MRLRVGIYENEIKNKIMCRNTGNWNKENYHQCKNNYFSKLNYPVTRKMKIVSKFIDFNAKR